MTVEELIDNVVSLRREVSTLTEDYRSVASKDAKERLGEALATKETELSKLLAAQVKYVVEPIETPPIHFLEYVQTEPWPKNFDCNACVVKAFNEPKFIAPVCAYCNLTSGRTKEPTSTTKVISDQGAQND